MGREDKVTEIPGLQKNRRNEIIKEKNLEISPYLKNEIFQIARLVWVPSTSECLAHQNKSQQFLDYWDGKKIRNQMCHKDKYRTI